MYKHIFYLITVFVISNCVYSQKRSKPYKEYDGVRFEGQKPMQYGGIDLELISFMGYKEDLFLDRKSNLKILFYFPYSSKDSLFIIVKEIVRPQYYYYMKPLKKHWQSGRWQEFDDWPAKDVLLPLGIGINEIGVVGRLNRDWEGSGKIIPMNIYNSKLPDSITEYHIHFKTQDDLRSLKYKVVDQRTNEVKISRKLLKIKGKVIYSIILGLHDDPAGPYELIFEGKLKDQSNMGFYRLYEFYHNPVINK